MKQAASSSETGKAPWTLWAIALLSLIALGLNIFLTSHFYSVRAGTAGFQSACNLSSAMNCDAVAASRYAELVFGIPLSSFGAGWFLGMFLLAVGAFMPEWRRDGKRAIFLSSIFGAVFSLYYFVVMAALLKTYCVFCLGVEASRVSDPGARGRA